MYTYVGDKKPGEIEGNNRYVIAFGGANGEFSYADAGGDPRSPKHRLGNLNMVAAVGMKPGETPVYVAGQGYIATRAEGGRGSAGPPRPARAGQDTASAVSGAAAPKPAGADAATQPDPDDVGNGVGGTARNPDHGAGFYWHAIQPF